MKSSPKHYFHYFVSIGSIGHSVERDKNDEIVDIMTHLHLYDQIKKGN